VLSCTPAGPSGGPLHTVPEAPSAASTAAPAEPAAAPSRFDRRGVLAVSGCHLTHDVYGSFVSTILPVLMERYGIPIGAAAGLASAYRLPSVLQPFLGYWADRYDARLLVVTLPAVTALAVTLLGLAPTYSVALALLLLAGLSSAAFHPAAGALVSWTGGDRRGRAVAYFSTGGEIGRMLGPVLIATVLTYLAVQQLVVLLIPAVAMCAYAFVQIAGRGARVVRPPPPAALRAAILAQRGPLLLMSTIVLLRSLSIASFQTYLPTFMTQGGSSLQTAGLALTIYEVGAVCGQLVGGGLSDRFGRRRLMLLSQLTAGPALFAALSYAQEPAGFALMALGGLLAVSAGSVQVAVMQELLPGNRSVATGISYFLSFESAVVATLVIGLAAQLFGLANALSVSVWLSMASLPFTFLLPETGRRSAAD
jgi:FSR family fosmidomycin resistance protein-like MFS transporter